MGKKIRIGVIGASGYTGADLVRLAVTHPAIEIVALTANFSDQVRQQCLAHGMQAFLSKPIDAGDLWATVSRYLKHE